MVEGKIPMTARRHVTNKLRTVYTGASKQDKARACLVNVEAMTALRTTAER